MIYMWKQTREDKFFTFQTNEKDVARILQKRKAFKQTGSGYGQKNGKKIWLFESTFTTPQNARRTLKYISGNREIEKEEDVFICS